MSSLQLDHVFCFCPPELPEVLMATDYGLSIAPGNRHPGQGTANRSILFPDNYLELIYLETPYEAESNPLQLDRRANWKKTGSSPFGIGLRGTIPNDEKINFWDYHPPYWPNEIIYVHKANERHSEMPLIFVVPTLGGPVTWPNIDKSLLQHQINSTKIVRVEICGPSYKWPLNDILTEVSLMESQTHHMKIKLDGTSNLRVGLNEVLTLTTS